MSGAGKESPVQQEWQGAFGKYACRNPATHTLNELEGEKGKLQPKERSWKAFPLSRLSNYLLFAELPLIGMHFLMKLGWQPVFKSFYC